MMTNSGLECLVRWILGCVFVYASIPKIVDPSAFAKIIYGYQLLPGVLINGAAIILPFVELYAGIFLIVGIFPRSSTVLVMILLGIFMMAISINLIRGHEFDCGCFSVNTKSHTSSSVELLIRDIFLFSLCLIPIGFRGQRKFLILNKGMD